MLCRQILRRIFISSVLPVHCDDTLTLSLVYCSRMTSRSPEFSQFRCRSRMRRRSRSAANIDPSCGHAVKSDPDAVNDEVDADFDWKTRRRSTNNVLSSRLLTWLHQRLMPSAGGAAQSTHGREPRTATKSAPSHRGTNIASVERPHTAHDCCTAAATTTSSVDALHLTPSYECKCASCPELVDTRSPSANAPADKHRCNVGDNKPPRHQAIRKTCSDDGFKRAASTSNTDTVTSVVDQRSLLSVPALFVTSYTRSLVDQHHHPHRHPNPNPQQQQQQQERRQSASVARQRLISMSDSRLGSSDGFTSSSAARIWKVTEFLSIGNAAAAADDRLLCRRSVFGLIDLCVATATPRGSADRWAPCNCGDQRRHRRSLLRLNVLRTDLGDVQSCFPTINRFVDGFRRRHSEASSSTSSSSSSLPVGCVMVYCETGDTLSVLAAAQYLVAVESQTVDQAEKSLSQAGCVTPLVEAFTSVLHSVYNQRNNFPHLFHHHGQQQQQQETEKMKQNNIGIDVVTQMSGTESSAERRRRLLRRRSETTILGSKSARPVMTVEAWTEN